MYIIKNLPVFLPLVVCIIISVTGINNNIGYQELSLKIIIGIVVFYLLGIFFRNLALKFLINVLQTSEKKARLIKEAEVMENISHTFNETARNTYSTQLDEQELDPYMPQKY